MINISGLNFSYRDDTVISDINLNIEVAEKVAIIGFNGSGKTTLIKLILGILKPSKGMIKVYNQHPDINNVQFKSRIGIALDNVKVINFLTVEEYLSFVLQIYKPYLESTNQSIIEYYIEYFNIGFYKNTLIKGLSHGTLKKVQLISSIIGESDLIIFDEPTNGLDFESILKLEDIIKKKEKETIIIASHDFEFLDNTCNKFYFLHKGNIYLLTRNNDTIPLKQKVLEFMEEGHI